MGRLFFSVIFLCGSVASATTAGAGSVLDLEAAGIRKDPQSASSPIQHRLAPELRACLFQNTLAFGASITRAVFPKIPFGTAVHLYETYEASRGLTPKNPDIPKPQSYRPYGPSPVRYLAKMLAGRDALSNIFNISQAGTRDVAHLGSRQMYEFIRGSKQHLFRDASLVIGVDAFYWDAIWDTCDTRFDPVLEIEAITQSARSRGKTVVLGTVPIEDPRLVRIDARRVGIDWVWHPPNPTCALKINAALHAKCTSSNNCYLVDLFRDVEDLKAGKKLELAGIGSYGYYEMRPDGVHLSDVGSWYVAQSIVKALEAHPPVCAQLPDDAKPMLEISP